MWRLSSISSVLTKTFTLCQSRLLYQSVELPYQSFNLARRVHVPLSLSTKPLENPSNLLQSFSSIKIVGNNVRQRVGRDGQPRRLTSSVCDTIFAVSSGFGKCGVCVVRVSGPSADVALAKLLRPSGPSLSGPSPSGPSADFALASLLQPQNSSNSSHYDGTALPTRHASLPPRHASLRRIYDPESGRQLDQALCLWFPGQRSFTGDDCFELHVHGGTAVVRSVLHALANLPRLRHAHPGEFSKKAFLNGKLDLTGAEGLADLINAETEAQQTLALGQLDGCLSDLYSSWAWRLSRQAAFVEASIDFGEAHQLEMEEDEIFKTLLTELESLRQEMRSHLDDARRGERMRSGVKVVIAGKPNAGKSSLLNLLVGRSASIVTPLSGTTRDVIDAFVNLDGMPVVLSDTAGLRPETEEVDVVEREGVRRANERLTDADVVVVVVDAKEITTGRREVTWNLKDHLHDLGIETKQNAVLTWVMNKTDAVENLSDVVFPSDVLKVSCLTGHGIPDLVADLSATVARLCWGNEDNEGRVSDGLKAVITRERHRENVAACERVLTRCLTRTGVHKNLDETTNYSDDSADAAMIAEDIRTVIYHLGKITGVIRTDDILEIIFKEFCIGK